MIYRNIIRLVSLLLTLIVTSTSAVGSQLNHDSYSLDDWMSVGSVQSFSWSPNGIYFYFTRQSDTSGTTEIFRVESDGGHPSQLSTNSKGKRPEPKQDVTISRDGKTLFFTAANYFQSYKNIFMMPSSGEGKITRLTFNDAVIETAPTPSPDGTKLAYFARTPQGTKILLLNLIQKTTWPRYLTHSSKEERFPVWHPDGEKLAFWRENDIWIRNLDGGPSIRLIEDAHARGNYSPVWSPSGSHIAFLNATSGFQQVGVAHVQTGSVTPITYSAHQHSQVSWSPDGELLVFIRSNETGMGNNVVVTSKDGSQHRVLTNGQAVRSSPKFSPDGKFIAYIETTPIRTPDIWIIPTEGGSPQQITNSMGKINPNQLSLPKEIFYRGPDNLEIPTLLYKPKTINPGQKYPVIVRLHGHPGQWNHSFQLMWQYFIQKGFVLIAPNPRGSRGFGQGFHDLHIADYGGTEFKDVMNVLNYLEKQPYVDMTRKATWGGSGGGYMSLLIATQSPKSFQAQIIRAPVSSWKLLAIDRFGASGRAWTATRTPRRERSEFGGSYSEIPEEYRQRSPLNFVEQVEIPQLLFHGLRDSAVSPRQSQKWVKRMIELGKQNLIDYVEYPDEDHSLRRYQKTVSDRLQRMEKFLNKHLRLVID